ncbi:hypothetical protein CPB84DRAFT_1700932 [Gymnopilus junonius]|uniref:RING-type domain-containing protein n=1 Tax=Gymnopilus junonius TaxID=109634 RepID=A0A9P5NZV6_GYMJU|nr:hypothetical protein CPB84DRAFT_1700932 [Gymnopilus junonius]
MPFALENGSATIPFWLTECGHVVCNNHLNRDQSCSQCGAQEIQLAPLQQEMELPMSEWFRSIPIALDSIAFAAKFQQEAMASQVRYHKARHQQLRQLVERFKRELSDIQRCTRIVSYDILQSETEQYRLRFGPLNSSDDPSSIPNSNGKRQMMAMQQFEQANRRSRTDSSPRTITTLLGPDRLTLLPGQQHPELSSNKYHHHAEPTHLSPQINRRENHANHDGILQHRPVSNRSLEHNQSQRPFSRRSLEHFAYNSRDNKTYRTHETTHNDLHQEGRDIPPSNNRLPPTSSRFKPATANDLSASYPANAQRSVTSRRQTNMGPPPIPQHVQSKQFVPSSVAGTVKNPIGTTNQALDIRRAPSIDQRPTIPTQSQLQQHSNAVGRRFFPQSSNGQSSFGSGPSRDDSRPPESAPPMTPGQRTPFLPNSGERGRFG